MFVSVSLCSTLHFRTVASRSTPGHLTSSAGQVQFQSRSIPRLFLSYPFQVFSTLAYAGSGVFSRMSRPFDVVVIDEAAQAVTHPTLPPALRSGAPHSLCARTMLLYPSFRSGPWIPALVLFASEVITAGCMSSLVHKPSTQTAMRPSWPPSGVPNVPEQNSTGSWDTCGADQVEPSTLIPMGHGCSQVFLVGDPLQLPATVLSTRATDYG